MALEISLELFSRERFPDTIEKIFPPGFKRRGTRNTRRVGRRERHYITYEQRKCVWRSDRKSHLYLRCSWRDIEETAEFSAREREKETGDFVGWLTPFANQLFESERAREAALAAGFKAYHRSGGTRRPEETGKGETRMEKSETDRRISWRVNEDRASRGETVQRENAMRVSKRERERDRRTRGRVWLQRDGAQPCTGERKSGRTSLKVPLSSWEIRSLVAYVVFFSAVDLPRDEPRVSSCIFVAVVCDARLRVRVSPRFEDVRRLPGFVSLRRLKLRGIKIFDFA